MRTARAGEHKASKQPTGSAQQTHRYVMSVVRDKGGESLHKEAGNISIRTRHAYAVTRQTRLPRVDVTPCCSSADT